MIILNIHSLHSIFDIYNSTILQELFSVLDVGQFDILFKIIYNSIGNGLKCVNKLNYII